MTPTHGSFPFKSDTRSRLATVALWLGALAVLVTGADHLEEYASNGFSTVPTIGTLFLLNFIAAAVVGVGLLLPIRLVTRRAEPIRALLAVAGIGIAASSEVALWISEKSSLFGFTDYGFRTAIVVAIAAEAVAVIALSAYLALARPRLRMLTTRRARRHNRLGADGGVQRGATGTRRRGTSGHGTGSVSA
jgi:hypothetical protein